MLFAGFAVADPGAERRAPPPDAARDRRSPGVLGNLVGSWIAYGVGRGGRLELVERHGALAAHEAQPHRAGRPLVPALRRAGGASSAACCRSSARSSRCPRASRRCRSGASRVLTLIGCIPWVLGLALAGRSARQRLDERAQGLRVRRLRGRSRSSWSAIVYAIVRRRRRGRRDARRPTRPTPTRADRRVPLDAALAPPRDRARAGCRARPSCCRLLLGAHRR